MSLGDHPEGLSVYLHLPFCKTRCPYCDFLSHETASVPAARYLAAVTAEWRFRRRAIGGGAARSIYIGGGTPSVFPARDIVRLLDLFPLGGETEVTVEANPGDGSAGWFSAVRRGGATRFSIGVQALDDRRLAFLGRRHSRDEALAAVSGARESGARSVSADLIYGTPGQTPADLEAELAELVGLGVDHVSCYELTVAGGTPLSRRAARGEVTLPDEERMVRLWQTARGGLRSRGLDPYEVSSYARPGHRSRHNEHYWTGGMYIGLGLGAHGFLRTPAGDRCRYANQGSLESYLAGCDGLETADLTDGIGDAASAERLKPLDYARERMMLGLRTVRGAPISSIVSELTVTERDHFLKIAAKLEADEMVRHNDGYLVPTEEGLLRADALAEEFF